MKKFKYGGVKHLLAICFFAFAVTANAANTIDKTIYYNGKVFTSDTNNLWAEGVVVVNKFIVAVGSNSHVLSFQGPNTMLVDLQGKVMIPGLNDSHVHPYTPLLFPHGHLVNGPEFIPGPGPSWTEMKNLVQAATGTQPAGKWIFGFAGSGVLEDPSTSRFELDPISPNHPVLLFSWYGHGMVINTKAMEILGIAEEQADPVGGFYRRVPSTNIINGIVHEYAEHQISRYFASQMTDAELVTMYQNFATVAAQRGYTSIQEYSVGIPQQRHVDVVDQANLPLKWRAMCFPLTITESCNVPAKYTPYNPLSLVKSSGIKWIADGTPFERFAFVTEDYADAPGERGHMNFTESQTVAQLARSLLGLPANTQGMFHSVGDGTTNTILDKMSLLASDNTWKNRRLRIEHGDMLRPPKYASARNKGVYVVQNPLHFAIGALFQLRYPPSILADMSPFKTLIDEGINVVIASDGVGSPGDPFLDIFFSVIDPFKPTEAVSVETAVMLYTTKAAEAEFQELWKGKIKPGYFADLAVLSKDIFTVTPPEILGTQSLLTVVNGDVVYDAGQLLSQQVAKK